MSRSCRARVVVRAPDVPQCLVRKEVVRTGKTSLSKSRATSSCTVWRRGAGSDDGRQFLRRAFRHAAQRAGEARPGRILERAVRGFESQRGDYRRGGGPPDGGGGGGGEPMGGTIMVVHCPMWLEVAVSWKGSA